MTGIATVRAAVADYLTAAAIPNLAKVYARPPFDTSDIPWDDLLPVGGTTNCVGIVYVDSDDDQVIGLDGAGGRRICTYATTVELILTDVSGDPATAQDAMDDISQAVKQRLRTDPALGTDQTVSAIVQAATDQLHVARDRPVRLGAGDSYGCGAGVQFNVQTYEYAS